MTASQKLVECYSGDMGDIIDDVENDPSVLVQLFRRSGRRALLLASAKDFDGTVYAYSPASQHRKHNLHAYFTQSRNLSGLPADKVSLAHLRAPLSNC